MDRVITYRILKNNLPLNEIRAGTFVKKKTESYLTTRSTYCTDKQFVTHNWNLQIQ